MYDIQVLASEAYRLWKNVIAKVHKDKGKTACLTGQILFVLI